MKRLLLALLLLFAPVSAASAQHVLNLRDADIRAFRMDELLVMLETLEPTG